MHTSILNEMIGSIFNATNCLLSIAIINILSNGEFVTLPPSFLTCGGHCAKVQSSFAVSRGDCAKLPRVCIVLASRDPVSPRDSLSFDLHSD